MAAGFLLSASIGSTGGPKRCPKRRTTRTRYENYLPPNRSWRRMRLDTHRSEPRRKIVDVIITQRLRHDAHHFMAAFAAAIRAELIGQENGRLARKIRSIGLGAEAERTVAHGTGLRLRSPRGRIGGQRGVTAKPRQNCDSERRSAEPHCLRCRA